MANRDADETRRDFLKLATVAGGAALASTRPGQALAQESSEQVAAPPPTPAQLAMEYENPAGYSDEELRTYFVKHAGSDFMVDVIRSLDIEYLTMNPGSSIRGIHESIVNYGGNRKPEMLTCLHEEQAIA